MPAGTTWTPHLRLSYGGTLGAPVIEEWSNTVRWKVEDLDGPSPAALDAALAALVGTNFTSPLRGWISRAASGVHQSAILTWAKLNWVKADGLQRDPVTHFVETSQPGESSSTTPPFYQTFAITLRTALPRGRAHSGRVFPPMVIHTPTASGSPYLASANAVGMAQSFATLLEDVRDAMGTAFNSESIPQPDPAVFSPGVAAKGTAPTWERILSCVVDRVPDVQHRRTHQVPRAEAATVALTDD